METIKLNDALKEMNSGEPFDLRCVTMDESRKTGGDFLEITGGRILKKDIKSKKNTTHNSSIKRQNHYKNATRNILLENGEFKKIHIWLITNFNGQQVALY